MTRDTLKMFLDFKRYHRQLPASKQNSNLLLKEMTQSQSSIRLKTQQGGYEKKGSRKS